PDTRHEERPPDAESRAPIGALLGSRSFLLLLAVAALIQGSHAVYYNLSTIHWRAHGITASTAGLLWAEAVLAEIVMFFVARGSVEKLRPTTMLMLGGALAAVRWLVLGATVSVPLLALANWLHAFSFGCTYLGALRALENRVPGWQRSTAQGLLGAASSGIGLVMAAVLGGYVYERFAGRAFFVMAALALFGVALALILRRSGSHASPTQSTASASPA
ncbi:MAG: MFS transporter, partial [Planctomycetes bacterium]|nr:MFS transporter [Planctomycetota bacterium]